MPEVWLESRLQSLTPRERQVLVLWMDPKTTVQDAADALGTTTGTVSSVRQSIRRKLAVPRGSEVVEFLRAQEADLGMLFEAPTAEPVAVERRRLHVLRSAIRDLEVTARRATTRAAALQRLAEHSDDEARKPMLLEAAVVELLAHDVIELRDRMLVEARSAAST